MGFKSGGMAASGEPFFAKISADDVAGSSAPTKFEWTYSETAKSSKGSVKSMKMNDEGTIYGVAGVKGT